MLAIVALALLASAPAFAQGGGAGAQQPAPVTLQWNDAIPPGNADQAARALKESSRHGEWVNIKMADGTALNSWVVYPERKDKAGVVLVIHDIGGMRDWPRALGDQLAQDGFIAIVPDFLSGKGPDGGGSASLGGGVGTGDSATSRRKRCNARLNAAMEYGRKLPERERQGRRRRVLLGRRRSFGYAVAQPNLQAAVVYYGELPGSTAETAPEADAAMIKAPVLGLYGGSDNRINSTLPATTAAMKKLGKSYETHIFEGAGHGFLGNQAGSAGANLKAAEQAWPLTLAFFGKTHCEVVKDVKTW